VWIQHSSDNFHSYPPDNHHRTHDVYWWQGGHILITTSTTDKPKYEKCRSK